MPTSVTEATAVGAQVLSMCLRSARPTMLVRVGTADNLERPVAYMGSCHLPAFVPLQVVVRSRSGHESVSRLGNIRNFHDGYGGMGLYVAPARGERVLLLDSEVGLVLEHYDPTLMQQVFDLPPAFWHEGLREVNPGNHLPEDEGRVDGLALHLSLHHDRV